MINDALKLTVDQVFGQRKGQQPYDNQKLNQFDVPGYDINENLWQLMPTVLGQQTLPKLPTKMNMT